MREMNRLERVYALTREQADLIEGLAERLVEYTYQVQDHKQKETYASEHMATYYRGAIHAMSIALAQVMNTMDVIFTRMSDERAVVIAITLSGFKCPASLRQAAREWDVRVGSYRRAKARSVA